MAEDKGSAWTKRSNSGPDAWVRIAAPIISHDAIIDGIFESILARYQRYNADNARGTVNASWLKDAVDEYQLTTLDQDLRAYIREQFDLEGIKVVDEK